MLYNNITKKSSRIYIIDYLKALCCILVIINHYPWTREEKLHPLFVFIVRMAVPIFMILSGYTFSMSAQKKKQGLKELYSFQNLLPKFYRFTIPVLFAYGFYLFLCAISGNGYSISEAVDSFLMADYGPGSYYYGMMLQLLIFFPVIYLLIKKEKTIGLIFIFIINLIFEINIVRFSIPYEDYRISLLRYFMYIAFGCYLFLNQEKKIPLLTLLGLFFIGLIYLLSNNYWGFDWSIFQFWSWSALPVAFFIFPIVYQILYHFKTLQFPKKIDAVLSLMGKASYHIFLVQMVYYQLEFDTIFNQYFVGIALIIHIIICVSLGISYYILENRISAFSCKLWKNKKNLITLKKGLHFILKN